MVAAALLAVVIGFGVGFCIRARRAAPANPYAIAGTQLDDDDEGVEMAATAGARRAPYCPERAIAVGPDSCLASGFRLRPPRVESCLDAWARVGGGVRLKSRGVCPRLESSEAPRPCLPVARARYQRNLVRRPRRVRVIIDHGNTANTRRRRAGRRSRRGRRRAPRLARDLRPHESPGAGRLAAAARGGPGRPAPGPRRGRPRRPAAGPLLVPREGVARHQVRLGARRARGARRPAHAGAPPAEDADAVVASLLARATHELKFLATAARRALHALATTGDRPRSTPSSRTARPARRRARRSPLRPPRASSPPAPTRRAARAGPPPSGHVQVATRDRAAATALLRARAGAPTAPSLASGGGAGERLVGARRVPLPRQAQARRRRAHSAPRRAWPPPSAAKDRTTSPYPGRREAPSAFVDAASPAPAARRAAGERRVRDALTAASPGRAATCCRRPCPGNLCGNQPAVRAWRRGLGVIRATLHAHRSDDTRLDLISAAAR